MVRMEFVLCLFVLVCTMVIAADPDYCHLPCGTNINTACERAPLVKNVFFIYSKCGPGPDCGASFTQLTINAAERAQIVTLHNFLRDKVATGNEERGKQPKAANMMALSYNTDLQYVAQCLANTCKFGHDKCRRINSYNYVGQNIASFGTTGKNVNKTEIIEKLILGWYNEVELYSAAGVDNFKSTKSGTKDIGHYTQMVWANTKQVGCGMTSFTSGKWNKYNLVCNYGPGGNVVGQPVYKTGAARSQCPSRTNNKKWPGLC